MKKQYFTLRNKVKIPKIGFGTWQIPEGEICYNSVSLALLNSYRHIDTATLYGNELSVGKAIRDSSLPRKDIFVTTKILPKVTSYKEAKENIIKSLALLDLEYIDLFLIHHPKPLDQRTSEKSFDEENVDIWKAMIEAYNDGKIRAIGVSNFNIQQIQNLISNTGFIPTVNQIRYFIGHTQPKIVNFCKANDILVQAYSPLATGRLLGNSKIEEISKKYNKTIPQIAIRFCIENNILPLPKSIHLDYIKANIDIDFQISKQDMNYLNSLESII